jgi:hypothetical protein
MNSNLKLPSLDDDGYLVGKDVILHGTRQFVTVFTKASHMEAILSKINVTQTPFLHL